MIAFALKRRTLGATRFTALVAAKHLFLCNDTRAQLVSALNAFFFFVPRHNRVASLKTARIMVIGNDSLRN
jgi:hypothetical protein